MTITEQAPSSSMAEQTAAVRGVSANDRPRGRRRSAPGSASEALGCIGASFAVVQVLFALTGTSTAFGLVVCWLLVFVVLYGLLTYLLHGSLVAKDRLATACIWVGASVALFPLGQILFKVTVLGAPVVFAHFPAFLVQNMAKAGANDPVWKGGMGNAIIGSIEQVGLATVYTVPISILTATYLSESSTRFSRLVRTIVDCMMGTPSIVAGLFVFLFWVVHRGSDGFSGFAASIALAILMLPIMIRTAEEVIRVVPGTLREAALALGSPRWKVSLRIVLPTVRSGLLTAMILGVALAVGETAPVLFTAKGSFHTNVDPFHGAQADLPLQILQLIRLSQDVYVRDAWGGAFILVFLVLALFVLARVFGSSRPGRRRIKLHRRPKEVAAP